MQYIVVLKGSVTVTFPNTTEVLVAVPGKLYVATDSAAVSALGHVDTTAGGSQVLMLPFADGVLPAHNATSGACP